MISPSKLLFFKKNGYLTVFDAYTKTDLLAFQKKLSQVIELVAKKAGINSLTCNTLSIIDKSNINLKKLREINVKYVSVVQAIISRSPEYYRLCSTPKVMSIIRYLNQQNDIPLYLTNNGIIFTHPLDSENHASSNIELEWHKDTFYTIPKSQFLHVWSPILYDATDDIGTLQVCPGSHAEGIGKQTIDVNAQYDHRYKSDIDTVKKYKPISIYLKVGQALIFNGCLLHRSGKNISDKIRCTLIGLHHDVSNDHFTPITTGYYYSGQTPEAFFYEVFNDENVLPLLSEQALECTHIKD